jgi:hypothetical protein
MIAIAMERVMMVGIYVGENKDKRHHRAIISINTLNDILAARKRKRDAIGPKFDKICGLTGSPSVDHREYEQKQEVSKQTNTYHHHHHHHHHHRFSFSLDHSLSLFFLLFPFFAHVYIC